MYTGKHWRFAVTFRWIIINVFCNRITNSEQPPQCGGTLTEARGILQTPGFPNEFRVPVFCKWVIDASEIASTNTSIIVYLTQLFVLEGLSFEEYETYDRRYNILGKRIHTVLENNVSKVKWVRTHQNVLVVTFQLQSTENAHLRILDHFLDVYGFNITYEISTEPVRSDPCTMGDCGFTGICYDDFTHFHCNCFSGYSGPTCSDGPNSLCSVEGKPFCYNGGTCIHVGTSFMKCTCPDGYVGEQCQKTVGFSTRNECNDRNSGETCTCSKGINSNGDSGELSTTLRLMQGPNLKKEDLERLLHSQIANSKIGITQLDQVQVTDLNYYEWGTEATIHFYGLKRDRKRLEALISRWTHAGHIGNLTLIDRNISLRNDSRLSIKSISINQPGLIREGDQFILSCVAQGTPSTSFRWFKDGLPLNVTQITSNKWFRLIQDPQAKSQYTALLGVDKASYLDEGTFVCEVEDVGVRQCLSRLVEIRRPPIVKIEPMSLTVQKGENFTIKCICISNKDYEYKFTYSWTKNKVLLPIRTEMEKYEILYPGGSILQVSRIEKPATYSCLVQDETASTEVSIQVDVVDRTVIHTCRGEKHMNILWPETAPGTQSIQECPRGFKGIVKRWCVLHDTDKSMWQLPDFSECTADFLHKIDTSFKLLHLGYEQKSGLDVLKSYRSYFNGKSSLLPGEGARILTLTGNVISFINNTSDFSLMYNTTSAVFDVVDNIMKYSNSLINQMHIVLLQQTVRNQILFSEEITKIAPIYHQAFASVDITIVSPGKLKTLNGLPIESYRYPSWYSYKLEIRPNSQNEPPLNQSLILACVVYKNLTEFLPVRSAIRLRDGAEMEYEIISNIVAVWLLKSDKLFMEFDKLPFVMYFIHSPINTTLSQWNISCSMATYASFGYSWDINGCTTETVNSTMTKCSCIRTGTYAVLITNVPLTKTEEVQDSHQTFVLIGCIFCLTFAVITEIILIAHWFLQKSSLTFLKVQYCFAITTAMTMFVIALSVDVPHEFYPYINTSLEIFLLIALSSHLSKCLIVFTEFVQVSKAPNLSKTVVAISTGVPVITVFASHLTNRTMGRRQSSWWLINGSVSFNIFITAFLIMIFLYNVMYLIAMERFTQFVGKQNKNSTIVAERKRLLKRSFYIFWSTIILICSSVMYINMRDSPLWNYTFIFSNVLLVLVVMSCYIIKPETSIVQQFVERFRVRANTTNKYPVPALDRSPSGSKREADFDREPTSSSTNKSGTRTVPHSKSSAVLLSDLQNIPTHTRSMSSGSYGADSGSLGKDQCGRHQVGSPYTCNLHKQQEYLKPDVQEYMYSPDVVATRVHVELDLVTPLMHEPSFDIQTTVPEEQPIILCNIAVNSRCEVNPKPFVTYTGTTIEEKKKIECMESAPKSQGKCERLQPEGVENLAVVEEKVKENEDRPKTAESDKTSDSLDGMLDKISHDLDYLLNRKTPLPSSSIAEETFVCPESSNDYEAQLRSQAF